MEESAPKITTAGKWAQRLRGRSRMAVAAIGGVFLIGFMGVSRPLSARTSQRHPSRYGACAAITAALPRLPPL